MQRRRLHSKGTGAGSPDHVELFNFKNPFVGAGTFCFTDCCHLPELSNCRGRLPREGFISLWCSFENRHPDPRSLAGHWENQHGSQASPWPLILHLSLKKGTELEGRQALSEGAD